MDFEEIGVFIWTIVDSTQYGLFESPCECGIESLGCIRHAVSLFIIEVDIQLYRTTFSVVLFEYIK